MFSGWHAYNFLTAPFTKIFMQNMPDTCPVLEHGFITPDVSEV
jgi:hypothetical protein